MTEASALAYQVNKDGKAITIYSNRGAQYDPVSDEVTAFIHPVETKCIYNHASEQQKQAVKDATYSLYIPAVGLDYAPSVSDHISLNEVQYRVLAVRLYELGAQGPVAYEVIV
jgi:hypothetical protein